MAAVHHALHVHANIGVLEPLDALAAPSAAGKQREGVARDLLQPGVVGPSRQGHAMLVVTGRRRAMGVMARQHLDDNQSVPAMLTGCAW